MLPQAIIGSVASISVWLQPLLCQLMLSLPVKNSSQLATTAALKAIHLCPPLPGKWCPLQAFFLRSLPSESKSHMTGSHWHRIVHRPWSLTTKRHGKYLSGCPLGEMGLMGLEIPHTVKRAEKPENKASKTRFIWGHSREQSCRWWTCISVVQESQGA